jgi:hypothetical protein
MPLSRALLEGGLGLEWVLRRGKDRWARQFYVGSLRQELEWARRSIPERPEHAEMRTIWAQLGYDREKQDLLARQSRDREAQIERLLGSKAYSEINSTFEALKRKKKREPPWYLPGPGGVRTIYHMAKDLDRLPEYAVFYRYASYFVHGSLAELHARVSEHRASITPVRDLEHFPTLWSNAVSTLLPAISLILEHYRPEELSVFRSTYEKQWRGSFLGIHKVRVTVNREPVSL